MKPTRVEITSKTILFTIASLLFLWVLYQIRSIVILFFISFIMATAVNPLAAAARRKKIPVVIPMMIVYLIVIIILSLVLASLVPAFISQSRGLVQNLPLYLGNLEQALNLDLTNNLSSSYLNSFPSNLLKIATGLFGNFINIFAVFFISYYLVLERPHLHHSLVKLFGGGDAEKRAEAFVQTIERTVGGWVRGELILMVVIGVMTYVALILLGIPYALPLAVLAGILELVPNLGPTIAAIPAILMGLTISPLVGLGALVTSILIQQLENNLIVPKIMQSATGTKPLATILVLLTGFTLGGVAGAILAMPLYLTAVTVYQHLNQANRKE